jgi:hypothetical protein
MVTRVAGIPPMLADPFDSDFDFDHDRIGGFPCHS